MNSESSSNVSALKFYTIVLASVESALILAATYVLCMYIYIVCTYLYLTDPVIKGIYITAAQSAYIYIAICRWGVSLWIVTQSNEFIDCAS